MVQTHTGYISRSLASKEGTSMSDKDDDDADSHREILR